MTAWAEGSVFGWLPRTGAGQALFALLGFGLAAHVGGLFGVRFGPWPLSPLPAEALGAGIVLAAAFLAVRGRALPPAGVAIVLAGGAAVAFFLLSRELRVRLDTTAPVLQAEVGSPTDGERRPETIHLRSLRLPHAAAVHRRLGRAEDVDLWVRGTLLAPRAGDYTFRVVADDRAEIRIDGALVLGAAGHGEAVRKLSAGPHDFTLRYLQARGPARLEVTWDRPGLVDLLPLEAYLVTGTSSSAESRPGPTALLLAMALHFAAGMVLVAALLRLAEGGRVLASRFRAWARTPAGRPALALAAAALLLLLALQAAFRSRAGDGLYFHPFTSEFVMQTVSVDDLRVEPVRSLLYLHIQPPAFDLLRALFAATGGGVDPGRLVAHVDRRLLLVWALVFAALAGLATGWVARAAGPPAGLAAGVLWLLHPAPLTYATVLDTTLLSAALFAWYTFELWNCREGGGSPGRLAAATLALFFTRSVFQWPFVLLTAAALWTRRPDPRALRRFLLLAGLPVAAFVLKQHALFGVTMTSTFGPDSFCKGLGTYCAGKTEVPLPPLPDPGRARVLSRTAKLDGEYNYNQVAFLRRSFSQRREYLDRLTGQPLGRTLAAFAFNARLYLRPSSAYGPHVLVDRLPWRRAYDAVFSGAPLLVLLKGAVATWARGRGGPRDREAIAHEKERPDSLRAFRNDWTAGLALALPVLYVVTATIVLERGENHRYKFFVEPVLFVFVAVQAARLVRRAALRYFRDDPAAA